MLPARLRGDLARPAHHVLAEARMFPLVFGLVLGAGTSRSEEFTVVGEIGETLPGGRTILGFGARAVGPGGHVAFVADTADGPVLMAGLPGQVAQVLGPDDDVGGFGPPVWLSAPVVAADGEVALKVSLDLLDAIVSIRDGELTVIAREAGAAPGGGTYANLSDPRLNAEGHVAFLDGVVGQPQALYAEYDAGVARLLATGDPMDGFGVLDPVGSILAFAIAAGDVVYVQAVSSNYEDGVSGVLGEQGVYFLVGPGGYILPVLVAGQAPPGGPGDYLVWIDDWSVGLNGHLVARAVVHQGYPYPPVRWETTFSVESAGPSYAVPSLTSDGLTVDVHAGSLAVDETGAASGSAVLSGPGVTGANDDAFVTLYGGYAPLVLAREGMPHPALEDQALSGVGAPVGDGYGAVGVSVGLLSGGQALLRADRQQLDLGAVIRTGETLFPADPRVVTAVAWAADATWSGPRTMAQGGGFLASVALDDGSSLLVAPWTPPPLDTALSVEADDPMPKGGPLFRTVTLTNQGTVPVRTAEVEVEVHAGRVVADGAGTCVVDEVGGAVSRIVCPVEDAYGNALIGVDGERTIDVPLTAVEDGEVRVTVRAWGIDADGVTETALHDNEVALTVRVEGEVPRGLTFDDEAQDGGCHGGGSCATTRGGLAAWPGLILVVALARQGRSSAGRG